MLILTRRLGETIQIGTDITLAVIDVTGQQVRLGINAPRDTLILREELTQPDVTLEATRRRPDK